MKTSIENRCLWYDNNVFIQKEGSNLMIPLKDKTYVMGILNVTPDSFSDGGQYNEIDTAVKQAEQMVAEGAHIIDVGGESTRPDHKPVSEQEEIERVVPVIKALVEKIDVPISIDTYKAKTAEAAVKAGASIINDIWGAKKEPQIASIAAQYNVPIILMHNRENKEYNHLINDMIVDLEESIHIAQEHGVKEDMIWIDPGIGFAKTLEDNYLVMQQLDTIIEKLPYPLLLGTSRKSFITKVLQLEASERDNATGATTVFGLMKGARIVRVHDVKRTVELVKMTEAMMKGRVH